MKWIYTLLLLVTFNFFTSPALCQSTAPVTHIYTDYNGFWSSGQGNINNIFPDNTHHLLAFRWNDLVYSTGVDNSKLINGGIISFTPTNFQAFPVKNIPLTDGNSTYFGFGEMHDGIHSGIIPNSPPFSLPGKLSDVLKRGMRGLDIGSGITNLPATSEALTFVFEAIIDPTKIGDNIPDIVISQIAMPNNTVDEVYFEDRNGNLVGNKLEINFTSSNAPSLGSWRIDFFNPVAGTPWATGINTTREIRLWARDASSFGINESNYMDAYQLRYKLAGSSDPAFLAYNTDLIKILAAYNDEAHTNVNQSATIPYLDNDVLLSTSVVSTTIVSQPSNGTAVWNANNTFTYTPSLNYTGTDQFIYQICDENENCDQAMVTVVIGAADLQITKSVSNINPAIGQNIDFTINIKNLGPQNATDVQVSDLLPTGFTYISHIPSSYNYLPNTGNLYIANIATDEETTLTIRAQVNERGDYLNTAKVTGSKYDPDMINNTSSVQVKPNPNATITGGGTVCEGTPLPGVQVNLFGQEPWEFVYNRNGSNFSVTNQTEPTYTIPNIAIGTYTLLQLKDGNGQEINLNESIVVSQISVPEVKITPPTCSDPSSGSLEVISPLGSGYEYQLVTQVDGDITSGEFQASPLFSTLPVGNQYQYSIVVRLKDLITCTKSSLDITIPETPVAQIISVDETCSGSTQTASSADQTPGNVYKWTISGGTFAGDVLTANTPDVTFTSLLSEASVQLHLKVTSSTNCISEITKQIDLSPLSNGGTLTLDNLEICPGETATLTLINYVGQIIKWQYRADGSSEWTDILHQQPEYITPGLTSSTYYRVVVKNGSCDQVNSNEMLVPLAEDFSIPETLINGNYCLNTPTSPLVIDGGVPQSGYTYQWYQSEYALTIGATPIPDASLPSYTPPSSSAGTIYYFVVKKKGCLEKPSNLSKITVKTITNAQAGDDLNSYSKSYMMNANISNNHTGHWELISVERKGVALDPNTVTIDDTSSPNTSVQVPGNSTTVLKWILDNGICTSEDTVSITSKARPAYSNPMLMNRTKQN